MLPPVMLPILLTWITQTAALLGLGLALRRLLRLQTSGAEACFQSFWLGWAFTLAFLQVWHLGLPVSATATALLLVAGVAGLIWNGRGLRRLIQAPSRRWLWGSPVVLLAIWLANLALAAPTNSDTGLYHLPTVRWLVSYPLVPGLGNLHGRLAFNSAHFLYVAALDVGMWVYRSQHLANGPLLLALMAQILWYVSESLRSPRSLSWHTYFHVLLLAPSLHEVISHNIASPSPDLPVFIVGVLVWGELLALWSGDLAEDECAERLLMLGVLAAVGVVIKLSFAATAGVAGALAMVVWIRVYRAKAFHFSILARAVVPAALLLLPWVARGVVLSGYMAYPSTWPSLPVSWSVPPARVAEEAMWIRSWARLPGLPWQEVLGRTDWVLPWARRIVRAFVVGPPASLAVLGGALWVWARRRDPLPPNHVPSPWLWLGGLVGVLGVWFFAAPDARFVGSTVWLLASGVLCLALDPARRSWGRLGLLVVTGVMSCLALVWASSPVAYWVEPGPDGGLHPPPTVALQALTTYSGDTVYRPREGGRAGMRPCLVRPTSIRNCV